MHDVLHDLFKESHHDEAGSRQAGGSGQGQGQGYPHWMMDMPGGSGAQYTSSHQLHAGSFCNKTPVSKILQSIFFSQPISRRPQHHPLLLPSHGQARGQEPRPGLGI